VRPKIAVLTVIAVASITNGATLPARTLPSNETIHGIFRLTTFKVQLDESHAVVGCTFDRSSSRLSGPESEYPHVTFKPNDAFIAEACRQISGQQHLYLPRGDDGKIEPLYATCTLEEESNSAACS
jgi:hypothetical protein